MSTPSPATKARIRATLSAQPALTRKQVVRRQLGALVGGLCLLLATALVHGTAPMSGRPLSYVLTLALGVSCLGALMAALALRFATSMLGPGRASVRRANRLVLPLLLLTSLAGNAAAPETLTRFSWEGASHAGCALLLTGCGGVLAALGVLALRRADALSPRATAALIGATAGAWASLAVSLQCPLTDPLHTALWHVLPVGLLMLLTVRYGARFVGISAS